MTKKKRRNPPSTTWRKIMQSIPSEAKFTIAMAADSSDEVYADIDTNIGDGEAWLIYGMIWVHEAIDPTVPLQMFDGTEDNGLVLQLHRNDDHELLVNSNDDDLLMQDRLEVIVPTGASIAFNPGVRRVMHRTITMQPTLRAIFRTLADSAAMNGATNQIAGKILYDKVPAPDIGATKLGRIANL